MPCAKGCFVGKSKLVSSAKTKQSETMNVVHESLRCVDQGIGFLRRSRFSCRPGPSYIFPGIHVLDRSSNAFTAINRTQHIFPSRFCMKSQRQRSRPALAGLNFHRDTTVARSNNGFGLRKIADLVARNTQDVKTAQIRPVLLRRRAQQSRVTQALDLRLLVLRDDIRGNRDRLTFSDANPDNDQE